MSNTPNYDAYCSTVNAAWKISIENLVLTMYNDRELMTAHCDHGLSIDDLMPRATALVHENHGFVVDEVIRVCLEKTIADWNDDNDDHNPDTAREEMVQALYNDGELYAMHQTGDAALDRMVDKANLILSHYQPLERSVVLDLIAETIADWKA